jgi:iron complex transport system substrate-binding protein
MPVSGARNVPLWVVALAVALALAVTGPPGTGRVLADGEPAQPAPQRIITLAPNSAEIICLLGACDSIVGVSKFCIYPPQLGDRPRVGGLFDPDLERIAALKPDLVVLRGRSDSVEQLCHRRGISVYHDRTERLRDVETCILELGKRLGRMNEARGKVDQFQDRLDAVRKRVADKPKPRVLLTVSRSPDALGDVLTTGRGTFLHEMLETAGGSNVFGHLEMDWPQVSGESIVARRPEVIIELMPEVTLTPALKRQMLDQWSTFGSIPAVADGRIHFVTDDHCLIPSPRYVEIIEHVSGLLHPETRGGP